jgi:hypothetical protein
MLWVWGVWRRRYVVGLAEQRGGVVHRVGHAAEAARDKAVAQTRSGGGRSRRPTVTKGMEAERSSE